MCVCRGEQKPSLRLPGSESGWELELELEKVQPLSQLWVSSQSAGPGRECGVGEQPSQPVRQTDRPQGERLEDDSRLREPCQPVQGQQAAFVRGWFADEQWGALGAELFAESSLKLSAGDFIVRHLLSSSAPWLCGPPGTNRTNFFAVSREEVALLLKAWQIPLRHSFSPPPSHGMPSIPVALSPDERPPAQQYPFSRGRAPGPGLPETPAAAFSDCPLCWKQWPIRLSLCHVEITH